MLYKQHLSLKQVTEDPYWQIILYLLLRIFRDLTNMGYYLYCGCKYTCDCDMMDNFVSDMMEEEARKKAAKKAREAKKKKEAKEKEAKEKKESKEKEAKEKKAAKEKEVKEKKEVNKRNEKKLQVEVPADALVTEQGSPVKKDGKAKKPTYLVMVLDAIKELDDENGSSYEDILKYLCANYEVHEKEGTNTYMDKALHKGLKEGTIKTASGDRGGSLTFLKFLLEDNK